MTQMSYGTRRTTRATALVLSLSFVAPILAGCGGKSDSGATPPPRDESGSGMSRNTNASASQQPKQGMSTGKKVALVAGAAALYYMYKRSKDKKDPQNRQYYVSEANGRVYYRDPNNKNQAVYVTAPKQPIEVPMEDARRYGLDKYRGYENSTSGENFGGLLQGN